MAEEQQLLRCHLLTVPLDNCDLLSSLDESKSCGLTELAWHPAGFHGHQLQHNLRMLQLMAGSLRARRSSQGQNGARMLASSVAKALSGYLRARSAKETGSGG